MHVQIAILAPSLEVATMANVVMVARVLVEVATTMAKVLVEVAILAKVGALVGVATINGLGGGGCQGAVVV